MRTIYEASIWAPGAIPLEEWKYRNLKRVMFPTIDLLLILGGITAVYNGVPAISQFYPDQIVDIFSYVLVVAGVSCLLGISFPRLWALEIAGKATVFSLIVAYVVSLFILAVGGQGSRDFVLIIAIIAMCPIVWRLSLLASEWQARVLTRKASVRNAIADKGE